MANKYKIPYINACIRAFAARFALSVQSAFRYLYRFSIGIVEFPRSDGVNL